MNASQCTCGECTCGVCRLVDAILATDYAAAGPVSNRLNALSVLLAAEIWLQQRAGNQRSIRDMLDEFNRVVLCRIEDADHADAVNSN